MPRKLVAGRRVGELEEAILRELWRAEGPLSGRELADRLPAPERAYTTVMTVLGRLVKKNLVERLADGRGFRYRAAGDPEQLTAQAIGRLVCSSRDPAAVLAHFVEGLDDRSLVDELAALLERVRRP
ncbi:MAG: BlaI/MecI/CopY family transcriptional regulator [Acidimicrobiales bacterium]